MKGQSTSEYILVVFVFISAVIFLYLVAFSSFPGAMSDVQLQTACLRADLLTNTLFKSEGIPENWELTSGQIVAEDIGFSTGRLYDLNYSKWTATNNLTYKEYLSYTNKTIPFKVSYMVNSFNWTQDSPPASSVDSTPPNMYIMRDLVNKNITIMAGTDDLEAYVKLDLLFPWDNFTVDNSSESSLYSRYVLGNSSGIKFSWNISSSNSLEYLNLTAIRASDRIYIRDASCVLERGSNCNITIGDKILVLDEYGGAGFDEPESICSVRRKGVFNISNDVFGVDLEVAVK